MGQGDVRTQPNVPLNCHSLTLLSIWEVILFLFFECHSWGEVIIHILFFSSSNKRSTKFNKINRKEILIRQQNTSVLKNKSQQYMYTGKNSNLTARSHLLLGIPYGNASRFVFTFQILSQFHERFALYFHLKIRCMME